LDEIGIKTHYFNKEDGYGNLALKFLEKFKYVEAFKPGEYKQKFINYSKIDTILFLGRPTHFEKIIGLKNILYTMFETDKIPNKWPNKINTTYDCVVVPSTEIAEVFRICGVYTKIEILPLFIMGCYKFFKRPIRDTYTFLFVGRMNKFNRKGWYELLLAFTKEFHENNVRLIFKSTDFVSVSNEMMQIMKNDIRIHLIDGVLTNEEINKLYKEADCFVLPSHGEGFGLPAVEAMATGLPVITTNFLGSVDYAKRKYCYPIEIKYLEEAFYAPFYGEVGNWAYIDYKDIKKSMRYCYENQEKARRKGEKASIFVDENFRFKNFSDGLLEIRKKLNVDIVIIKNPKGT